MMLKESILIVCMHSPTKAHSRHLISTGFALELPQRMNSIFRRNRKLARVLLLFTAQNLFQLDLLPN